LIHERGDKSFHGNNESFENEKHELERGETSFHYEITPSSQHKAETEKPPRSTAANESKDEFETADSFGERQDEFSLKEGKEHDRKGQQPYKSQATQRTNVYEVSGS
jgi:hypothetical protein